MQEPKAVLTPREAATILGVSYPTIKKWILAGKLKTTVTPGGHHRVPAKALNPFLHSFAKSESNKSDARFSRLSGRNQLVGRIVEVRIEGLLAKVVLAIGEQRVTAIITSDAARALELKKGDVAAAVVKATEVMIARV
jgi:molybdopterin-binding protein